MRLDVAAAEGTVGIGLPALRHTSGHVGRPTRPRSPRLEDRAVAPRQAGRRASAVSRRQGVTWAATSVPEIRRQWCNALDQIVDRFSEGLAPPQPGTVGAGNRRLERTQAKLATEIEIMKAENNALRGAELFWVARDMVDVSMDAASTLPECYVTAMTRRQRLSGLCSARSG